MHASNDPIVTDIQLVKKRKQEQAKGQKVHYMHNILTRVYGMDDDLDKDEVESVNS